MGYVISLNLTYDLACCVCLVIDNGINVSVKAEPRSVTTKTVNDTMKDKLTEIVNRVRFVTCLVYLDINLDA